MGAGARLAERWIELPTGSEPVANYRMAVRTGDLLFFAGRGLRSRRRQPRPLGGRG